MLLIYNYILLRFGLSGTSWKINKKMSIRGIVFGVFILFIASIELVFAIMILVSMAQFPEGKYVVAMLFVALPACLTAFMFCATIGVKLILKNLE